MRNNKQNIFCKKTLAVALWFHVLFFFSCNKDENYVVLYVNNEPVKVNELKFWMSLSRAEISAYFFREHGIHYSADFWEKDYGNELPILMLKERAVERLVEYKVQQILARELGVIESIGFDELMLEMKDINDKRKLKLAMGEPIYGPKQFTSHAYFFYVFDKMVYDVKHHLINDYSSANTLGETNNLDSNDFIAGEKTAFHNLQYIDRKYEILVNEMIDAAEVTIVMDVYDKITH